MNAVIRPHFRFNLRTLFAALTALSVILVYAGSYYRISRCGVQEMTLEGGGDDCFLYIPMAEASANEDLSRHYRLRAIYAPANLVDRYVFGGPNPVIGIMWLSDVGDNVPED
jgi:hypothetical protein